MRPADLLIAACLAGAFMAALTAIAVSPWPLEAKLGAAAGLFILGALGAALWRDTHPEPRR